MDGCAVGEGAEGSVERPGVKDVREAERVRVASVRTDRNCLPNQTFPGYPSVVCPSDVGPSSSHNDEGPDLASFLISDSAGYINGEMVVQDGGAHLRGSGAEDLLQWTEAQWEKQRAARSKS